MEKQNEEEIKNEPVYEELDFNNPSYQFIPGGSHEWSQRGPYLICKSCDLEHASWIGMQLIMTGLTEDGKPILSKRV